MSQDVGKALGETSGGAPGGVTCSEAFIVCLRVVSFCA